MYAPNSLAVGQELRESELDGEAVDGQNVHKSLQVNN
jgi:hypothetical protein